MKEKHSRLDQELATTEWNFRAICPTEIEMCCLYEYAREFAKRTPEAVSILRGPKSGWLRRGKLPSDGCGAASKTDREFQREVNGNFFYLARKFQDTFPDTSWQDLDPNLRSTLATGTTRRHFEILTIQTLDQLESQSKIGTFEAFQNVHKEFLSTAPARTEYGFFAINWNHPDTEIGQAFACWLSERRRERGELTSAISKRKPRTGRGRYGDRLNWLAALRLKEHYRKTQLSDYTTQRITLPDSPYLNYPDLCKSAKKARQLFNFLPNHVG